MSKNKDYTKFSKPDEVQVEEQFEVKNEEIECEPDVAVESKPEPKTGVVTGCKLLNVRCAPYADADIVCAIDDTVQMIIDESESTEDFYKICTSAGIEGFCMKKFIAITP